jgi:hypothetical protein
MLRLLDTLALILAPLSAAWDQEFGGRTRPTPAPTPEPAPTPDTPERDTPAPLPAVSVPTPAPAPEPEEVPLAVPVVIFARISVEVAAHAPADADGVRLQERAEVSAQHPARDAGADALVQGVQVPDVRNAGSEEAAAHRLPRGEVTTPEPLYVRRGEGRGARYAVADPGEAGERWRRRMRGARPVYERCG